MNKKDSLLYEMWFKKENPIKKTFIFLFIVSIISVSLYALVADNDPKGLRVTDECAIAEGKVVIKNPLSNWKIKSFGGPNACYLEKTDSPENACYLSPQIEVVAHPRKNIGVSVGEWAKDTGLHTIDAKNPEVTDATLSGKNGKKLFYMKTHSNFDETKSIEVVHLEYFFLEPDYALKINIQFHEAESEVVNKELESILSQIKFLMINGDLNGDRLLFVEG
jgi:hypothetical protein